MIEPHRHTDCGETFPHSILCLSIRINTTTATIIILVSHQSAHESEYGEGPFGLIKAPHRSMMPWYAPDRQCGYGKTTTGSFDKKMCEDFEEEMCF